MEKRGRRLGLSALPGGLKERREGRGDLSVLPDWGGKGERGEGACGHILCWFKDLKEKGG